VVLGHPDTVETQFLQELNDLDLVVVHLFRRHADVLVKQVKGAELHVPGLLVARDEAYQALAWSA
jgi:hypothetical protein